MHNRNRSQIMSPMKGVGLTNISHIDITRIPVTTGKRLKSALLQQNANSKYAR